MKPTSSFSTPRMVNETMGSAGRRLWTVTFGSCSSSRTRNEAWRSAFAAIASGPVERTNAAPAASAASPG